MALGIQRYGNSRKPEPKYPVSPFRLFEDLFNDWALQSMEDRDTGTWAPPTDIFERDGNLHLMVSLPGLGEKEIDLKVEGQVLTVHGERKAPEPDACTYHRRESCFGNFSRSFTLPDSADPNAISAEYKNGILTVTIPQKPEVKPRTIKVHA